MGTPLLFEGEISPEHLQMGDFHGSPHFQVSKFRTVCWEAKYHLILKHRRCSYEFTLHFSRGLKSPTTMDSANRDDQIPLVCSTCLQIKFKVQWLNLHDFLGEIHISLLMISPFSLHLYIYIYIYIYIYTQYTCVCGVTTDTYIYICIYTYT